MHNLYLQRARIFHTLPLLETPNPDPSNSKVLPGGIKRRVRFVAGRGRGLRAGRQEAGGEGRARLHEALQGEHCKEGKREDGEKK